MKLIKLLSTAAVMTFASSVYAIPMSTVGDIDNLVTWGSPGNSEANETQFFADYLGVDASLIDYTKYDSGVGDGSNWELVDGTTDVFAFDFESTVVDLFLVKMENGVGLVSDGTDNTFTHFMYENDNQYGVIDLSIFDRGDKKVEIYMLSHTSASIGETTVPEPSILALLGLGMFGLGAARMIRK